MKRPLACADFTFPLLSHDQSLDLIGMLGFDGVDIGLFEKRSHRWPSKELRQPRRAGRALAKKAADRGLRIADVFLQMAPDFVPYAVNHPQPARRRKAREGFLRTLDYAAAARCAHVTVLPGAAFDGEPRRASLARSVDELAWRADAAARHGLVLGVEAHIGSIVPRPRAAARLVQRVPGLTLTLDYCHFTRAGLPDADIEPLIPLASHFHVRGARRGRLQAAFDDNTIDYQRVIRRMDAVRYAGWLGVEYVWTVWERCNECDNLSETIRFRDHLGKLAR